MNSKLRNVSIATFSLTVLLFAFSGLSARSETAQLELEASTANPISSSSQPGLDNPVNHENVVINPEPAVAVIPVPGTAETSSATLQTETSLPQSIATPADSAEASSEPVVAQTITPGRATRSGSSYIAVGGNIGFGGRTALGRGNFVITSKVGLTNNFSARPGLVVGRSPTILLPVTVDFPVRSEIDDRIRIAPFVGGGLAISTRGGSSVRALATSGVDIPITDQFTATANANAAFFRRPEIGVILGVGYNF